MNKELNRRDFLKNTTAVTAGVATIASGITLTTFAANDNPVTNEKRWGMLVDTNKLTESNINDMVNACQEENGWGSEIRILKKITAI
jgi:molybdopterin-containing oxidoreductase family iron-sulfur binding subunit